MKKTVYRIFNINMYIMKNMCIEYLEFFLTLGLIIVNKILLFYVENYGNIKIQKEENN